MLPGTSLLRLSHWDDPVPFQIASLIKDLFVVSYSHRAVLKALLHSELRKNNRVKEVYSRFRSFFPLISVDPDIVHFEWNSAAIYYLPLFTIWNCPVVISCRGRQVNILTHLPHNTDYIRRLTETFQRAAAVHCVSEAIKWEAMQYGLDPAKAWVIRPAVDPTFFCPPQEKPALGGTFHIVSTGSLIWRKGYEYALFAVRKLVDAGIPVSYEIIGDGPEKQRVLFTIDDLQLHGHVHLPGKLSPQQVRDRLQLADVFLLSSLSEGISNAVLEAMACGIPVVTTDCGGMREAVSDGVEGFIVPLRDTDLMAQRLRTLWEDRDLRGRMGYAGRQRILREFTLDRQINQFLSMYRSVISASK